MHQVGWDRVWWTVGGGSGSPSAAPLPGRVGRFATDRRCRPRWRPRSACRWWWSSTTCGTRLGAGCTRCPRSHQQGLDGVAYEVLVVEGWFGSRSTPRLLAEVSAYGPEFRLIDLAGEATSRPHQRPSTEDRSIQGPERGADIRAGPTCSSEVLRATTGWPPCAPTNRRWSPPSTEVVPEPGSAGRRRSTPATTRSSRTGRSAASAGPGDGYRLFEVGHFIGDRDWFDGIIESSCLFVLRWLLGRDRFLRRQLRHNRWRLRRRRIFERLAVRTGVSVASILGEGSFHRFPGGTTANVAEDAIRRVRTASYCGPAHRGARGDRKPSPRLRHQAAVLRGLAAPLVPVEPGPGANCG